MFENLKSKKGVLLKNTIMLYIFRFSTYFFSLIVVPYQTRILGPEFYAKLGVATSIMLYFQMIVDFGFILSATEDASKHRDDNKFLGRILSNVTYCKAFLSIVSFLILFVLCMVIPSWKEDTGFFMLYLVATVLNAFIPDYIYRGIEKMTIITIRAVSIKFFFTIMIFILMKQPQDYYVVPILNIIGNGVALILVMHHLHKKMNIRFEKVSFKDVLDSFKCSSFFFYSNIATTVYTSCNTMLLGIISPGAATGYYTSADKLIITAKGAFSPISDSMYPYMVRNKDFKLLKKMLKLLMPIVIVGCAVVFIFAEPFCLWFFGEEYAASAPILRSMIPVVLIALPNCLLGFPTLSPMGLQKYANYALIFGSILHIAMLVILFALNMFNGVTIGIATSITESVILIFKIVVIVKNKSRLKNPVEEVK